MGRAQGSRAAICSAAAPAPTRNHASAWIELRHEPHRGRFLTLVLYAGILSALSTPTSVLALSDAPEQFGNAISMDGDMLVIGAPGADSGDQAGSVFLYDVANLATNAPPDLLEELRARDATVGNAFGTAVDIHEGEIVVGSPGAMTSVRDPLGSDPGEQQRLGAAYRYRIDLATGRRVVTDDQKIGAFVGDAGALTPSHQRFGAAVTVFNGISAVGAPASENESGAGTIRLGQGAVVFASGFEDNRR